MAVRVRIGYRKALVLDTHPRHYLHHNVDDVPRCLPCWNPAYLTPALDSISRSCNPHKSTKIDRHFLAAWHSSGVHSTQQDRCQVQRGLAPGPHWTEQTVDCRKEGTMGPMALQSLSQSHWSHDAGLSDVSAQLLSGLLNALDSVAASEGCILFAITNRLKCLDPAESPRVHGCVGRTLEHKQVAGGGPFPKLLPVDGGGDCGEGCGNRERAVWDLPAHHARVTAASHIDAEVQTGQANYCIQDGASKAPITPLLLSLSLSTMHSHLTGGDSACRSPSIKYSKSRGELVLCMLHRLFPKPLCTWSLLLTAGHTLITPGTLRQCRSNYLTNNRSSLYCGTSPNPRSR